MQLSLLCFGSFQAVCDGQAATFATSATRALLAYLAVEADCPHGREFLAALLWPEQAQTAAYANLRQTLARARKALPAEPAVLETTKQTIRLVRADVEIDVVRFEELLRACAVHLHEDVTKCAPCVARLEQAVELYRGEFLHGLFLDGSQPFEEWLLFKREQLQQQVLVALDTLACHYEAVGKYSEMRQVAMRQLALDPWREEAHAHVMRALASMGERSAALAQYETCCRILERELGIEPGTEIRTLQARIRAGEQVSATPSVPMHNLPTQLTPFVGRERELAELAACLQQLDARLLTLVGVGGMGKTRLAVEAARAQLDAFPKGVFFVALAALTTASEIAPAIATTLGLSLHGDLEGALRHTLRSKHLLLVLDNFEHVLDGAELVVTLLEAAPHLCVLATSREQLNVRGEHVYHVPAMDYATGAALAAATTSGAVRLFVQSTRRVQPQFRLNDTNVGAVLRICQLVDGMPLGLELAAAWTETLGLGEIAQEIERSADFLAATWRDAPPRHRSLRAVFDWSWQLLNAADQHALLGLAVFQGEFTGKAALDVVGASLQVLTRLRHKSLVRWGEAFGTTDYYAAHPLLRQFAAEKLAADPAWQQAVQTRYVHYYLRFAAERADALLKPHSQIMVAELRREIENCRHALLLAMQGDANELLIAAIKGLLNYWKVTGHFAEGEALTLAAINALEEHATGEGTSRERQLLLCELWLAYGDCLRNQAKYAAAAPAFETAVTLALATGDQGQHVQGLLGLCYGLTTQDRLDLAQPLVQAAHALTQQHNLRQSEAQALVLLSYYNASLEQRIALITKALHIFQAQGDWYFELFATQHLAGTYENEGYYAHAIPYRQRCVQLAQENGDVYHVCEALALYGNAYNTVGMQDIALDSFQQVLALVQQYGFVWWEKWTLIALAELRWQMGDLEAAYASIQQARGIVYGPTDALHVFDIILAHILTDRDELVEAETMYRRVVSEQRQRMQMGTHLLPGLTGLAHVAALRGAHAEARGYVDEILALLAHPHLSMRDVYFDLYRIYLVCYEVLQRVDDERAAVVLETGQRKLREQAKHIDDPQLRHAFLHHVAVNRALGQLPNARAIGAGATSADCRWDEPSLLMP